MQASQAYLSLGIAYVGEGQESLAKASFREAAVHDPDLVLSAFEVSPKVRELFQQAKDELAREAAATAAAGPEEKKGGSKLPIILIGVGGAAAAGIVAAGAGGGDEGPRAVSSNARVSIALQQPNVVPLVSQEVSFAVTTTGIDAPSAEWQWEFGDGASSNDRGNTYHAYNTAGTFEVTLTVRSGSASAAARLSVTVQSLAGSWDGRGADGETFEVQLTQNGSSVSGAADGAAVFGNLGGRGLTLQTDCSTTFEGVVSDDANTVSGVGGLPCRVDRRTTQTLTRRQ